MSLKEKGLKFVDGERSFQNSRGQLRGVSHMKILLIFVQIIGLLDVFLYLRKQFIIWQTQPTHLLALLTIDITIFHDTFINEINNVNYINLYICQKYKHHIHIDWQDVRRGSQTPLRSIYKYIFIKYSFSILFVYMSICGIFYLCNNILNNHLS